MNDSLANPSPETSLAWLVLLVVAVIGAWRCLVWWLETPAEPDPWDNEAVELGDPVAAEPLCLRCLEPHPHPAAFCPHCCAPVGDFNNYSPYLYVFSVGELLRTGTSGSFRRSWLTLAGFVILGAMEYLLFAPVYWLCLVLNLRRRNDSPPPVLNSPP